MSFESFNVHASSNDMRLPVHTFPGDENISLETYRQAIFCGYLSTVSTLYGVAEGYGLRVDGETFERWKRIGAAAGLLDDFLDESPDIRAASMMYREAIDRAFSGLDDMEPPEWADHRLQSSTALLRNSVSVLPQGKLQALLGSARAIGAVAHDKVTCTDLAIYTNLLKKEAYHSGLLVWEAASLEVAAQPRFAQFSEWCNNAIEFGTLADSARDLWADRKAGRTSVEATLLSSAKIALEARRPGRTLATGSANRRATRRGMRARIKFSCLPTNLTMKLYADKK